MKDKKIPFALCKHCGKPIFYGVSNYVYVKEEKSFYHISCLLDLAYPGSGYFYQEELGQNQRCPSCGG